MDLFLRSHIGIIAQLEESVAAGFLGIMPHHSHIPLTGRYAYGVANALRCRHLLRVV
jgi:hypothetical protein